MDKKLNENRKPVDNSDLAKLPRTTLAKSMANLDDIMVRHIAGEKLTEAEEALLDRVVSERTGKRVGSFAAKKAEPKFKGLTISADGREKGQLDPRPVTLSSRVEPETYPGVVTKGSKV